MRELFAGWTPIPGQHFTTSPPPERHLHYPDAIEARSFDLCRNAPELTHGDV